MEEIPDKAGEIDIVELMEERLPPYVVRCFLAAGYDTPEVISSMDICGNESNSVNVIESFILLEIENSIVIWYQICSIRLCFHQDIEYVYAVSYLK